MKIVFSDSKSGHTFQKEVEKDKTAVLVGKKIGDSIEGSIIGLDGYTLQITGGSDKDGFPMRFDVPGSRRVNAVLERGTGVKRMRKGTRVKKKVVGGSIVDSTAQVNTKVTTAGPKSLADLGFTPKPKEEKKKEEKK